MADVRVGISGWTYRPWRGIFYPPGLPQRQELGHAASVLNTIEVNGTFYGLQRPASFRSWFDQTPDDFVFAVKAPRYITHMRRLVDVRTPLANFLASGVLALGRKLGPLLWQLPPTLALDADLLTDFLGLLPHTTTEAARLASEHDGKVDGRAHTTTDAERPLRHVLEVRHPSFAVPELAGLLQVHDVGLVVADSAGRFPHLVEVTSDLVYVRLHGDAELYVSGYTDESLAAWATKVRRWHGDGLDVHVYFDNDVKVRAPFDAMALAALVDAAPSNTGGLRPGEQPPSR